MKHPLRSKTILSSIMVIIAMLALLLGGTGIIELSPELQQMLQALAGVGGAPSLYGRIKADTPIGTS